MGCSDSCRAARASSVDRGARSSESNMRSADSIVARSSQRLRKRRCRCCFTSGDVTRSSEISATSASSSTFTGLSSSKSCLDGKIALVKTSSWFGGCLIEQGDHEIHFSPVWGPCRG